jgi:hypothetical protein
MPKKELHFLWRYALHYLKNGFRNKTILFYPEYPLWETEIFKIVKLLHYNVTNNPRQPFDLVIRWEDTTFGKEIPFLHDLNRRVPVLNLGCTDISKQKVEAVFQEVFGYGTFVDPTLHVGTCVRKNDLNACHDGQVIQCPIREPEPGFIYQKLLNNLNHEQLAIDYRITIIGEAIPYMWLRYKPLDSRFSNTVRAILAQPEEVFTAAELDKLRQFCRQFGLHYGELDIIRHSEDGRIYVLDANNTPWSPAVSAGIPKAQLDWVLERSAEAFRNSYLR